MKRVARIALIVVATLTALVMLYRVRDAIVLLALSIGVGAALRPLVRVLERSRLGRIGALLVSYLLIVLVLGGGILLAGGALGRDAQRLADIAAIRYERAVTTWPTSPNGFLRQLGSLLPEPDALYEALAGERGATAAQALLGAAMGAFDILGQVGVVLILSVYWSVDRERLERLLFSLLPSRHRVDVRDTWHALEESVGAYIRVVVLQTLAIAALLWAGYGLAGLEYAALTGVISAILGLIPWLGVPLGVLGAGILAVGDVSIPALIGAALYALAVHAGVRYVMHIQDRETQRLSSLIAVFLLIVMVLAIGLPGLLVAPPLAVGLQILYARLVVRRPSTTAAPGRAERLAALRERVDDVREQVTKAPAPSPAAVSLLQRLEGLLRAANTLEPAATANPRPQPAPLPSQDASAGELASPKR
ncbi:MAG: AI-2E family transporter [Chloroflexi bacterium]|nr:AI-2E family transporter [Chloroflexota bacterium]